MLYTSPDMAFAKIEPTINAKVFLYNDGEVVVSAVYDGDSVTIYAENDNDMLSELNVEADPVDVALAVESAYAKAGIDTVQQETRVSCYDYEDEEIDDQRSMIMSSESEYDEMFYDLISSICYDCGPIDDDVVETIKNTVLGMLALKFNISVYRPAFIKQDDGSVKFTEFPYEEMASPQDTK